MPATHSELTPGRFATLELIIGAVMISFSGVFVKLVSVPPTTSAFYRMFIGGIVLVVIVLWRRERLFAGKAALFALIASGVAFTLDLWFWHRSIVVVGPGLATLLAAFQVFVMALAGVVMFGERLRWEVLISIPMALLGLAMIVGFDWLALAAEYRVGVIFGLLTAVCYAWYLLAMRRVRERASQATALGDVALSSLIAAAMLAFVATLDGSSFNVPSIEDASWLATYGVVAQVLGWVLISRSLAFVRASRVGLILLLQPVMAFVWDVLFFGRGISNMELTGAFLAVAAIYLGSRQKSAR